jgi:hypothetical protein
MRHLYGVVLAVAMAAAVFFAASWAYLRVIRTPIAMTGGLPAGGGSLLHYHSMLQGGGALLGVGLLAGLLMVIPWVSPLASGLPGLVLLAWTGLYVMDVKDAFRFIPLKTYTYGAGFEDLLTSGLLGAVGMAMIVPLFVPSRWRRRVAVAALDGQGGLPPAMSQGDVTEAYQAFPSAQETTVDSGLLSDWAQTRPQPPVTPSPPPRSQAPWGPADYSG